MFKNSLNKLKKNFIETKTETQRKAITKLIICFVFILFLLIFGNTTNNGDIYIEQINSITEFEFSLEYQRKNNFHYIYTLNKDYQSTIYEGDIDSEKEKFIINNIDSYYKYDDTYLKEYNGVLSKTEKPRLYDMFLDIDKVIEVLKKSTLDSKTEYNDKKRVYNYLISTSTILKILDQQDVDLDDIPNKITIYTDSKNNVIEVNYDLSYYAQYMKIANNFIINVKYSKLGEIEIEFPE